MTSVNSLLPEPHAPHRDPRVYRKCLNSSLDLQELNYEPDVVRFVRFELFFDTGTELAWFRPPKATLRR